jgi:hypothetical protein
VIISHSRQEKRSRIVWITFHCRGTTSSVSVTSSPSFDSLVDPARLLDQLELQLEEAVLRPIFLSYPTAVGRHVSSGIRQSMPDNR